VRKGSEELSLPQAQQRGNLGGVCFRPRPPARSVPLGRRFRLNLRHGKKWRGAMIDKFVRSVAEALDGVKDGSTVLIAGFAQVGEPRALIDGLIEQGARDLVVV